MVAYIVRWIFRNVEQTLKTLYNNMTRQGSTDNRDKALTLFTIPFSHYLDLDSVKQSRNTNTRDQCKRNVRVNWSLIGHRAALFSGKETELLPTTAQRNCTSNTGYIVGEIGIGTMNVSSLGISSSEREQATMTSPRRGTDLQSGWSNEGNTDVGSRMRLNGIDFGVSSDTHLPPSTGR